MIKAQELAKCQGWVCLLLASIATPAIIGAFVAFDANLVSHVVLGAITVAVVSLFQIKQALSKRS